MEVLLNDLWRELLLHIEEEQAARNMTVLRDGEPIAVGDLHLHHYPNCLLLDVETQTWNIMQKWPEKEHLQSAWVQTRRPGPVSYTQLTLPTIYSV